MVVKEDSLRSPFRILPRVLCYDNDWDELNLIAGRRYDSKRSHDNKAGDGHGR